MVMSPSGAPRLRVDACSLRSLCGLPPPWSYRAFQDFTGLKNSRPFTVKSSLWSLILILFKYFIYIFNILQDIKYKDLL